MTSEPAPLVVSLPDSLATIAVRERAWLRRADRCRLCALGAVGFALWLLAVLFRALESHPPDSGEVVTPGAIAGLAVFLALFVGLPLLFAWRIAMSGIWMGREGIVVQGPLRTWTIPLEEARGFSPGVQPGYGPNGTPCPMLTRDSGRPVGIWALGREGWVWRYDRYLSELEPLCDELNAVLRRVQEGAGIAERPGFRQQDGAPVASTR